MRESQSSQHSKRREMSVFVNSLLPREAARWQQFCAKGHVTMVSPYEGSRALGSIPGLV